MWVRVKHGKRNNRWPQIVRLTETSNTKAPESGEAYGPLCSHVAGKVFILDSLSLKWVAGNQRVSVSNLRLSGIHFTKTKQTPKQPSGCYGTEVRLLGTWKEIKRTGWWKGKFVLCWMPANGWNPFYVGTRTGLQRTAACPKPDSWEQSNIGFYREEKCYMHKYVCQLSESSWNCSSVV